MRWLVRFLPTEFSGDSFLASMKAVARSVGAEARNPKWTSYGALELDIFCPTILDFETFLAAAKPIGQTEFVTDLNKAPKYLTDSDVLSRARALFNAERYWECHEALEGLWWQKQGVEKRLLQGIILVCAAFVHHQKGEDGVALSVLGRGAELLDYPHQCYGVLDVSKLRSDVRSIIEARKLRGFRL